MADNLFVVLDEVLDLAPLNLTRVAYLEPELPSAQVAADLDGPFVQGLAAMGPDFTSSGDWEALVARAQATGRLRTAALGMSITSGCGSLSTRLDPHSKKCDVRRSWSRVWHELVGQSVASWVATQTYVQFKNAVAPDFFGQCTNLPPDLDLLLLEWAANAWAEVELTNSTLYRLRWAAPHALFVFVSWPRIGARSVSASMLRALAEHHRSAMVIIDTRRGTLTKSTSRWKEAGVHEAALSFMGSVPKSHNSQKCGKHMPEYARRQADCPLYGLYTDIVHPTQVHTRVHASCAHGCSQPATRPHSDPESLSPSLRPTFTLSPNLKPPGAQAR